MTRSIFKVTFRIYLLINNSPSFLLIVKSFIFNSAVFSYFLVAALANFVMSGSYSPLATSITKSTSVNPFLDYSKKALNSLKSAGLW